MLAVLALMAVVAVLARRGGCASLILVGGGFFVSFLGPGRVVPMAICLAIGLLVLTVLAAGSQERRTPRRDWCLALLGLLWCILILPVALELWGVPLEVPDVTSGCRSNLKNIGTALEMYSTDFEGRYPRELGQLTPNYLKTIPNCRLRKGEAVPEVVKPLYAAQGIGFEEYGYQPNPEGEPDSYVVWCRSGHPSLEPFYPKYTSLEGLVESSRWEQR